MSGIYIPNMEMPKDGHFLQILITENGDMSYEYVCYNSPHMGFTLHKSKAIEVPTHGRLGDLDALQKQIEDDIEVVAKEKGKVGLRELWQILNKNLENAPTVIEASKERE